MITQREFVNALAPLTPQNYNQTLMMLRTLYREDVIRSLATESPVSKMKSPLINVKPQKFMTWEEISTTNFGKFDSHIKFLALHGLRWEEAAALQESDIFNHVVHINKSVYGPAKTAAGVRDVPYFGYFKKFPKTRVPIAQTLKPFGICIHSLRKTYAYFLETNGVLVTTAARFMGHSNPMIRLKIYKLVRNTEIYEFGDLLSIALQESKSNNQLKVTFGTLRHF